VKSNGLSHDGDNFLDFVMTVMSTWFHKEGVFFYFLGKQAF
jgi:hypothetical protein